MIFEPYVWDLLLIAIATYTAIASLVVMMRSYRQKLVMQMRTVILERRALVRAKAKPKSVPEE